jgi:signal transduction histidine kinase
MIHGLLNLSRAGKVVGEFTCVDLVNLVGVVQADLSELVRSRRAIVRLLDPHAVLWGDPQRLHQLVANLMSNAIKYNRSPVPCVEIGIMHSADGASGGSSQATARLTLFVRDNGIGIEPRFHQTVFQLFRQIHAEGQTEGSGVGLAICAKIAQAHGGKIWLESEPGEGSTFFVTLPRGPACTAPEA